MYSARALITLIRVTRSNAKTRNKKCNFELEKKILIFILIQSLSRTHCLRAIFVFTPNCRNKCTTMFCVTFVTTYIKFKFV